MGDLSSVAAEGEVFSQDPRPVPPDQETQPGADEMPDGQNGQGAFRRRGDVQPTQKAP